MIGVGFVMVFVQGGLTHRIAKKIGDMNTLRLGLAGILVGLVVLGFSQSINMMVVSACICAAFVGLSTPALTSLVSQYSPSDMQGGMLGLNQSMASLGRILGPLIGGVCFDYIHIRAPFPVGGILVLVALVLLFMMKPKQPVNAEPEAKV
jgi:MFS family permease